MEEAEPLVLCMENVNGEEVTLRIEPEDDFRAFLDKARSILGYNLDLKTITRDQPVELSDNAYQFLVNLEKNHPDMVQTIDANDAEYLLDDGTEIRASQIHFDNEDDPIDLTLEKLPFVKIRQDVEDVIECVVFEEVNYKITASPLSSARVSPKPSFINEVPFKLACNNTNDFEAQFTKYLEQTTNAYAKLNNVKRNKFGKRALIKDNIPEKDEFRYTREEILNLLKDSPITGIPYEVTDRKHVRKTDPTRMVQKTTAKALDIDGLVIADGEERSCFICNMKVKEKLYIFDNEDQKLHRLPQKIVSTQLKVVCEACLKENFEPSLLKGANQLLTKDEYLVIKNNQQYIFRKTSMLNFEPKVKEIDKLKSADNFVNDKTVGRENMTKHVDLDIVIVKDEINNSSDVEIIEEPEIDNIIDNLEDADEEVKQFLGKYEDCESNKELKCRFCNEVFISMLEITEHSATHKHFMEDDVVYPCPICDYGYSNFTWLKGHMKAAHERKNYKNGPEENKDIQVDDTKILAVHSEEMKDAENLSQNGCDIEANVETNIASFTIKTEVKQECLSSDDEIWIVHTGDEEIGGKLDKILKVGSTEEKKEGMKKGHKCYNCSQFFPTPATLESHKCRKLAKNIDEDVFSKSTEDTIMRKKPKDPSEIVTCNECNQSFTSKVRLKFHMQFHTETPLFSATGGYKCMECDELSFPTESALFDHVHFTHHNRKQWQCPVDNCGKTFFLRATLTKHSRTHTDTRRYVCVKCGKRFLDKQTLDEHGVTHLQTKPFSCPLCPKQLTRVSRLRMHVRAHRERAAPARAHACSHCHRAFAHLQDAQDHATKSLECMQAVVKEVKLEIEEPTVQLSPTSGLVRHTIQVIHSPEPRTPIKQQVPSPIAAPLLSQLTEDARPLIRIVEIDKAFRCEFCEDVFYTEDGLNRHRQIHKGVTNPFTCHICKVSFPTYSRCTTHKTTHGLYKQGSDLAVQGRSDFPVVKHFLCEDCGRSYLHWTYLQVHRRMKHPVDNYEYKCTHCDMTFQNSWSLAYHRKKFHTKERPRDGVFIENVTHNYKIPCRDCDEILPNKNALYRHRKKEHSITNLTEHSFSEHSSVKERSGPIRVPRTQMSRCAQCTRAKCQLTPSRWNQPVDVTVIEIPGLNPTTEEVINYLTLNNITREKNMEVHLMTFAQGSRTIVPNCGRALSMMTNVNKTPVILPQPVNYMEPLSEDVQMKPLKIPIILQKSDYNNITNTQMLELKEDIQEFKVQYQILDGAVSNDNIVSVSCNEDKLRE